MLLAAVSVLAYGSILWNGAGFSHPDDLYAVQLTCCDFRPLLALSYQLNAALGGWILTNFLLHLAVALLVFKVSESLVAGCLFAAHPMAADAVASVAGRSALLLALMVLVAIAIGQRWKVAGMAIGFVGVLSAAFMTPWHIANVPAFERHLSGFLSAITLYIAPNMVFPMRLSAVPHVVAHPLAVFAGSILVAGLFWLAVDVPRLRLGVGLLLLPLLALLVIPLNDVFLDHRAYIALAGFSMVAAKVIPQRLVLVAIGFFIAGAHARAEVYRSSIALFEDAVRKSPRSADAHHYLANAYARFNRTDDVIRELETSLRLDPSSGLAWKNLAAARLFAGDVEGALKIFEEQQELLSQLEQ